MTSNSSLDGTGSVSTYQLQDSTPIITGQAADLNPGKHKSVSCLFSSSLEPVSSCKQHPSNLLAMDWHQPYWQRLLRRQFSLKNVKNKILHSKHLYSCLLSVKHGKTAIVVKVNHSNRAANDAVES